MAISSVGSRPVAPVNVNNGNLEKAVQGDNATTKATTGGDVQSAGIDGSVRGGAGGNFTGDSSKVFQIDQDIFE
jgi:hypothetical protein